MARIVLRPRASTVVAAPEIKASLTDQRTDSTRPGNTSLASRSDGRVYFTAEDLESKEITAQKLNLLSGNHGEELAALRALPFVRGVLLEGVRLDGCLGQVASISTTSITLWRPRDALGFKTGDQVFAATTDGTTSGTTRNSGAVATVSTDGSVNSTGATGTVVATANWTTSIAALAVGDFLFLKPRTDTATGQYATGVTYYFETILEHRLGVIPKYFWVLGTTAGTRTPDIVRVSATVNTLTVQSTRSVFANIFIAG
jgi:hypothetical protein